MCTKNWDFAQQLFSLIRLINTIFPLIMASGALTYFGGGATNKNIKHQILVNILQENRGYIVRK